MWFIVLCFTHRFVQCIDMINNKFSDWPVDHMPRVLFDFRVRYDWLMQTSALNNIIF